MARIYVCDRCRKQFKSGTDLTNVTIPKPPNNYKYKNEHRQLEFCNSCMNNLNELCDPVPIEGSPMPFNQD